MKKVFFTCIIPATFMILVSVLTTNTANACSKSTKKVPTQETDCGFKAHRPPEQAIKPARQVTEEDLHSFTEFHGRLKKIDEAIATWGICDSAVYLAGSDKKYLHQNVHQLASLREKIIQNILPNLPTLDEDAKLYHLETEYIRSWWMNYSGIRAMAQERGIPVKELAETQIAYCFNKFPPEE